MYRVKIAVVALLMTIMSGIPVCAEDGDDSRLVRGLHYGLEVQASLSDGATPLWLNANKHGLSSLEAQNGYLRTSVCRPLEADSMRQWAIGYGLDLAAPVHYTSSVVVQQFYADVRWKRLLLSVGTKEREMELKDNELSSGSQTLGINARPVPQIRLEVPDYYTLPFARGWLHVKGHLSFGMMTDGKWQRGFAHQQGKYADGVLYHSKAGYLMSGKKDARFKAELGLEMAAQFGGTAHNVFLSDGTGQTIQGGRRFKDFLNVLVPGGNSEGQDVYLNVAGNHLGSWVARFSYETDAIALAAYMDKYFEDHSAMLFLDYDGYGKGPNWNRRESNRFVFYPMKDVMIGGEVELKRAEWLKKIIVEYIYTKYQSGPIYHDHTTTISDHLGGNDNYYNHYVYSGWQHWGQVIGNPLYRSPIYNSDGQIQVENSRFRAWHAGISGNLSNRFHYRLMATFQNGLGTYSQPFNRKRHNVSMLAHAEYRFKTKLQGWSVGGSVGIDNGSILGNNRGMQLTIKKTGVLGL